MQFKLSKKVIKKLLTILFLFCSLSSFAQEETHDFITYDTTLGTYDFYTWQARITRPANYFTTNHPDTASRPILLTMPGQGEGNTNFAGLQVYGPHYWLNNGWDGSITTGNGKHYPILITIKPTSANPRIGSAIKVITALRDKFHPRGGKFHAAGLSMGAFTFSGVINGQLTSGGEEGMKLFKSLVLLQGAGQGASSGIMGTAIAFHATNYSAYGRWAKVHGGTFFGLEGTTDTRNIHLVRNGIDDSIANRAYFAFENIGGGAHCCYNTMYDPSRKNWKCLNGDLGTNIAWNSTAGKHNSMGTYKNGWSVFEWMFRQGDTTLVGGGGTPPPPVVNAGDDQTITLPVTSTTVTGTATPGWGATITSTTWSKISGPAGGTITSASSLSTTITGMSNTGTYSFRLGATDSEAQTVYDTLNITVNPEPPEYVIPAIKVGPGEYAVFFLGMDKLPYGMGANTFTGGGGGGTTGVPQRLVTSPSNLKFNELIGALHGGGGIDTAGRLWITGDNIHAQYGNGTYTGNNVANLIETDSLGNPFTNIDTAIAFFYKDGGDGYNGFFAVKKDGTLWVWGRVWKGLSGDGNDYTGVKDYTRPTQIVLPDDRRVKMITGGQTVAVLCTDGTVWTWGITSAANAGHGGSQLSPTQLESLGTDNKYIAGCWTFWYVLKNNGSLYGWGANGNMMNDPTHATGKGVDYYTPTLLDNQITNLLSAPIVKLQVNFYSTAALCSDGTLWTWGDNAEGSIGNGFKYQHANPYAWNFNTGLALVKTPYNVGSGKKFKDVWGGTNYGFYWYALDENDNLYNWGRNKGSVLANQIRGANASIVATYQDSWNREWPTLVNPFAISTAYQSTSPYCIDNPSGSPCNTFTIPANTKPTANAGSNQSIDVSTTTLNGSASTDNVFVSYYEWKQVSGPNTAIMETPGNPVTNVKGLVDGTYTFRLVVTDNGWMQDSTTMTVTVGEEANIPPYFTSWKSTDTLTLPTDSVRLIAQGVDDDGTITSYTWSVISATTAPNIAEDTNDTTWVYNLTTTGNYVFRCTITDNDGGTASADITVTVLPQPGNTTDRTFNVNLTDATYTESGWTNWNLSAGLTSQNFVDDEAGTSTYYATLSHNDFSNANTNSYGVTFIPNNVVRTVSFFTSNRTLTIQGLQSGVMYNLYLYSTRNNSGNTTRFTVGGNSVNIASSQNTSDSAKFFNIEPSAGTITVSLERVGGSYNYLNGFTLEEIGTGNVNEPPVADAGSNQTISLPTSGVTLNGSGSTDPDGTISDYAWTLLSGPSGVTIETPANDTTNVTGLSAVGVYNFQLQVTDNEGATATDVVSVTVNPADPPPYPTVTAGADQTIFTPETSTTLEGQAEANGDATIVSSVWSKVSGPAGGAIASPASLTTTITSLQIGTYVYRLKATDSYSQTDSNDVVITVTDPPSPVPPPDVFAGNDQSITLPTDSVTLTGTATANGDASISTTTWTKVSGPAGGSITNPSSLATTVTSLQAGTYVYRFAATDSYSQTSADSITITVYPEPIDTEGKIKVPVKKRQRVYVLKEQSGTDWVNVLDFRHVSADDNLMIQAAIDYASESGINNVRVPAGGGTGVAGRYMINPTGTFLLSGVLLRNNTRLMLDAGAVLKATATSSSTYAIVTANNICNATIEGGTIEGERHEHTGVGGEGGHGIVIASACNITIRNITTKDCWGDGIYIRKFGSGVNPSNINIDNVISDGNRRQGMSIISVDGALVTNSIWQNTNGVNPKAGIDLEPNNMNDTVKNVIIENCQFLNNEFLGMHIWGRHGPVHDIFFRNNFISGNPRGLSIRREFTSGISVENVVIENSTEYGLYMDNDASGITVDSISITTAAGIGMRLNSVTDIHISNMQLQAHTDGIQMNIVSNISIEDSKVEPLASGGDGIRVASSNNISFSNTEVAGSWDNGINSISNNYFSFVFGKINGSNLFGAYINNNRFSTFDNNIFSNNKQVAFRLGSGGDGYNSLSGNEFITNGTATNNLYDQVLITSSARRNTIAGNIFRTSVHANKPRHAISLVIGTQFNTGVGNTYESNSWVTSPLNNEGTNNTVD